MRADVAENGRINHEVGIMSKEKRPVGRPRTTVAALPDGWQYLIEALGREGHSDNSMMVALGISDTGFATLMKDDEEFSQAIKQARRYCHYWWENLGREGAIGKAKINPTIWIFNMKNRFGWRDKTEVDHQSTDGTMTPTTITRVIIDGKSTDPNAEVGAPPAE